MLGFADTRERGPGTGEPLCQSYPEVRPKLSCLKFVIPAPSSEIVLGLVVEPLAVAT